MREVFDDSFTEAVLLVDASNSLNHQVTLYNMQTLCPTILVNTYTYCKDVPLCIDNCFLFLQKELLKAIPWPWPCILSVLPL